MTLLRLVTPLAMTLALTGCHGSLNINDPIRVVGRLSFKENTSCAAPLDSQVMSWRDCHAFKKQFAPATGLPITENKYVANAHRPLASTVKISILNPLDPSEVCNEATVQTDEQGYFDVSVGSCGYEADVLIAGEVFLRHAVLDERETPHTTVALWSEERAEDLFDFGDAPISQSYAFTSGGTRYAIPTLGFTASLTSQCPAGAACEPPTYALDGIELLADSTADSFGYLRQVLSSYSTIISLHERLQAALAQPTRSGGTLDYFKMYSSARLKSWGSTYRIYYDDNWAAAGSGAMHLYRPDRELFEQNGLGGYTWLLSSTFTLPHEFGHSIHGSLARSSFVGDYSFANPLMRTNGEAYDWGHGNGQYQELGTAMAEGLASSMGQYLLNECKGGIPRRIYTEGGASDFFENMWNPQLECDARDGCSYHHVRWHLVDRGLSEGTSAFDSRISAIQNLTQFGIESGHFGTISNSEGKISAWGCDLMDDVTATDHAGFTRDLPYLDDYTYLVGEALDGQVISPEIRRFPDGVVAPEEAHLSLIELISVLGEFCPSCSTQIAGNENWGHRYNTTRLSVHTSPLSPQSFMRKMEIDGYITRDQINPVLQSNMMELLKD